VLLMLLLCSYASPSPSPITTTTTPQANISPSFQFNLGVKYIEKGDYTHAIQWWMAAADPSKGNDAKAQASIGVMYVDICGYIRWIDCWC
jgi:hypothetical protein